MREVVPQLLFDDVFDDVTKHFYKVDAKEYQTSGIYPVIDQGGKFISGYTDTDAADTNVKLPVIVFGDHTRRFKYVDFPFVLGADGTRVLAPKRSASVKYLFYFLSHLKIESAGYSRHFKFLKRQQIQVPPIAEQKRIAAVLDKADEIRQKRELAISKLDQLSQSVFVEMFGEIASNARGWAVECLQAEVDRIQTGPFGSQLHKEDYIEGGTPLVNPTHIVNGRIVPDRALSVAGEKYTQLAQYHLEEGDVILGRRGEMGRCAVVAAQEAGWLCGTGSLFIRPKRGRLKATFLAALLSTPVMRRRLENVAQGVTMPNLNTEIVGDIRIIVPPYETQERYEATLLRLDGLKRKQDHSSDKLSRLFSSMQHGLFGA